MQTILAAGTAEQTINKSRFYAWAAACKTEQEVGGFLRAIAAQHQTAHHLAYAFRIKTVDDLGNHMIVPRFSDAGEPSGTAGKPILQMLEGQQLINVCVGVIRYYGGINLGTGGLARAYGGTAKMALQAAKIVDFVEMQEISLTVDYNQLDTLLYAVAQHHGVVLDKAFDSKVCVKINLPAQQSQALLSRFS
jgi:uncharacterized YigZ family protein